MSDFITSSQFLSYIGLPSTDTQSSTEVSAAITAASQAIVSWCGRDFTQNTSSTTTRVYRASHDWRIEVDDFSTTTGLVVKTDDGDTGTYGTTWTITTDFVVEPANLKLDGLDWAYTDIRAVGARSFPIGGQRDRVQVTAAFGWPAVPDAIKQATRVLALDIFKMKDSPFGVAGFNEYGVVRVRENHVLQMLLRPYRKHALMIG